MTLVVNPKSDREKKIVTAFLSSLDIKFYTEEEEDKAMLVAMEEGRKSKLLTSKEQELFFARLRKGK